MVKALCYILSICLLFLAGLPCADSAAEPLYTTHADICEQGESSSAPEADHCSPFCPCSCIGCHGVSMLIQLSYFLALSEYLPETISAYSDTWYQANFPPILQPPRIG